MHVHKTNYPQCWLQGCFTDAWGFCSFLAPICCKVFFSRQMRKIAITEIKHHHSFNMYLSEEDLCVIQGPCSGSVLTVIRHRDAAWFGSAALMEHSLNMWKICYLRIFTRAKTQSGIHTQNKRTKNKPNILWKTPVKSGIFDNTDTKPHLRCQFAPISCPLYALHLLLSQWCH